MVLPGTRPWMSTSLRRGDNWTVELLNTLREARACIICVTADSLQSSWETFEAGMLYGCEQDPVLIRCLCLDVPPATIAGGPLALISTLRLTRNDILTLLRDINGALSDPVPDEEIEARYERGREYFNTRLATLPEARGHLIQVVVQTPKGLCPIAATVTGDTDWGTFVEQLRERASELVSSPVKDLLASRCLDLTSQKWLETPVVLAELKAKRIALVPSEADEDAETHSARYIAQRLRESLEIQPAQRAAMASMERDLRDLLTLQTNFYDKNRRYANYEEIDFWPSPGTSIEVKSTESGFHAVASRTDSPASLAVRLGDGAGRFQQNVEGSTFIPEFEASRFYVLKPPEIAGPAVGDNAVELQVLPQVGLY
jgi:hypothetical protein